MHFYWLDLDFIYTANGFNRAAITRLIGRVRRRWQARNVPSCFFVPRCHPANGIAIGTIFSEIREQNNVPVSIRIHESLPSALDRSYILVNKATSIDQRRVDFESLVIIFKHARFYRVLVGELPNHYKLVEINDLV